MKSLLPTEPMGRQRLTPHRPTLSFAAAALAALMISSSASAQERVYARVTASALHVRTGPGTGYRILGSMPNGTRVELKSQSGAWSEIAYGVGTAWAATAYLAPLTAPRPGALVPGPGPSVSLPPPAALPPPATTGALPPPATTGALPTPFTGTPFTGTPFTGTPATATPATATPATTPPAAGATPGTSILSSLLNGLRPTGSTGSTGTAQTGSTGTTPTGTTPTGTTPTGTAPTGTTPTGTAPSAPASTTPIPTSSAYNPSGTVPGSGAGYIQLKASGAGHYSYYSAARKYGRPALIYGLERISGGFASSGHKMGVGDISQNGGGTISGHASHKLGVDVDVRPCRKDKKEQPVTWQETASYDRETTQKLANLFGKELKLTNFFYNDPQVSVRTKQKWPNHDNHFHARINPA